LCAKLLRDEKKELEESEETIKTLAHATDKKQPDSKKQTVLGEQQFWAWDNLKLLVAPNTRDSLNPSQNFESEKKEEVIGLSGVSGASACKTLEDFGKNAS